VGIQGLLSQCLPYSDKDKRRVGFWLGVLNERRTLREAGLIVAESEYSKRATSLYSKACITVVPQPLRDVFVSTRPGHRDQKTVVFVGAHIKRKGFIDALRAFSMLGQDDWTLICIGSMSPANRKLALELVNNLGISRQVQLLGPRPAEDIVRYLKHSPVFLLPSYIDTGPNALKEALAMGVWPVCYDNSGPKEFVSKYRFGSLSKTGDINALAASLRDALTTQPWRDSTRALECADAIRRDLDRERIWEQLTKLYRERSAAG
jgi:glycosyltransferase involved in cell wall biosynthesis